MIFKLRLKGGPGSGHRGHAGRPGKRGGSSPGVSGAKFGKFSVMLEDVKDKIPKHLLEGYSIRVGDTSPKGTPTSDAYFPEDHVAVLSPSQSLAYRQPRQAIYHIAHELGHPPWYRIVRGDLGRKVYDAMPADYFRNREKFANSFATYFLGYGGRKLTYTERAFFDLLSSTNIS